MARVVVFHAYYGCETGCCGHVVELGDENRFEFTHPYGNDHLEFAKRLVEQEFGKEHVADLVWEDCNVLDD